MGNSRNAKKLTREEKEKAVELAISGGDPIGYLKELGLKNPWASWAYIKQTLRTKRPELYAKLPSDDDRLEEEISYGTTAEKEAEDDQEAVDVQTSAEDELAGFEAVDMGAPEGDKPADMVIKAEDIKAALDPAVARMEAFAAAEQKLAPPVRSRGKLVMDEHGLHTVKDPEQPKPVETSRKGLFTGEDGRIKYGQIPDDAKTQTVFGLPCVVSDDMNKRSFEKMTMFGIPCELTGLKVDEFEFNRCGDDLQITMDVQDFVWMRASVKLTVEQWKKLVDLVPNVLKIFGMDK